MSLAEILPQYGSPLYVEIGQLIFIWGGGPYIDIFIRYDNGHVGISDQNINVWDYEDDKAIIDFTPNALLGMVIEWIDAE